MITGPLCRAARALVEWPRDYLAQKSGVSVETIADYEMRKIDPGVEARVKLQHALEQGGAIFLPEGNDGLGVRLKFRQRDVRQINRLENEGGPVGEDDI
jgi:transcriptional regulator with XRE-family HTH domain